MNSVSEARRREVVAESARPSSPAATEQHPVDRRGSKAEDDQHANNLSAFVKNRGGSGDSGATFKPTIRTAYYGDGSALFMKRSWEANAISIDDVHQGAANDCYFEATVAGLANDPRGRALIERSMKALPNGNIEVAFANGKVEVDPTRLANGGAHFGGGGDSNALYTFAHEQWPAVLEAAYAKYTKPGDLAAAYEAIGNKGMPETPMRALGLGVKVDDNSNGWAMPPGEFIKKSFTSGSIVVVETPTNPGFEMRGDHAYTVVGIDGNQVELRDPITGATGFLSFAELQGMKRVTAGEIP